MHAPTKPWPAWIRSIALLGMGWAAFSATSIETLIPAFAAGIGLDSLARLASSGGAARYPEPGRRLHACFGLAMSAAIVLRPSFSILTLSFILLLQVILWLVGDGIFRIWALRAVASGAMVAVESGTTEVGAVEAGDDRSSVAEIGSIRLHETREVLALVQVGFGIALHIWPGAGALDRGPVLALAFLILAVDSFVATRIRSAR